MRWPSGGRCLGLDTSFAKRVTPSRHQVPSGRPNRVASSPERTVTVRLPGGSGTGWTVVALDRAVYHMAARTRSPAGRGPAFGGAVTVAPRTVADSAPP